jgi:integration host factor subunit beta
MNKSGLVEALSNKANLTQRRAEEVINIIFDSMKDAILNDNRIEIRGFGSFVNRKYGSYTGRNPKTGDHIKVKSKRLPFFKVGKELREKVNKKK